MTTTPKRLGLPEGYKYRGMAVDSVRPRVVVEVRLEDAEATSEPQFVVHFVPLVPFGEVVLPDFAMIEKIDASTFSCDIDIGHVQGWAEEACEAYGGLPIHLNTWDKELSYFQGRWIDRMTGEPLGLEERIA